MAASATVPFTITYTASAGGLTTATVLGQVLNNGQTNWIPASNGDAIYLNTASAGGESATVFGGNTYYLSTGAPVPDQVTGITASGTPASSTGSSASGGSGGSSASPGMVSTSYQSMSSGSAMTSASPTGSSSSSSHHSGAVRSVEFSQLGVRMLYAFAAIALIGAVAL
ncbi:hypothetical protein BDY17DRAFT_299171 [Neohortaea acidophila]|uniref:Uncharacterized protein n=1 Tax=Neohortaea acidophila TaxID=245834 RepID=A0A6A6PRQ2_9PEZI|nr:uncharacterized protein BDY17DRAFT_299171 [Neohortaea acidophila]KAF2482790.1 hypothetical protein BDY17DRAFT_299171 [Neohortaea acidophila]